MKFSIWILGCALATAQTSNDYHRATPECGSCREIEKVLEQHAGELSPDARLNLALKVAKIIEGITLKGKPLVQQKREIYFAINASTQVLVDDFDSETIVKLIDLREKAPKPFDFVLWRFTKGQQEKIIERMRAFKEDKIRPNATIPPVKDLG